jgi:hypothetical protein
MFTDEQKTRIKNSVFSLKTEKRHKLMQLASYLSNGGEDENMEYSVYISYLDNDMNKKLDADFKEVMNSGISVDLPEEDTKPQPKIPKSVRIQKGKSDE